MPVATVLLRRGGGSSSVERLVECVRLGVEAGGAGVRVSSVLELHHHAANAPQHDAPDLARAAHRLLARSDMPFTALQLTYRRRQSLR